MRATELPVFTKQDYAYKRLATSAVRMQMETARIKTETAIDAARIKTETAKEIVRLSELYLDGTIRLALAGDARAISLSGMLAASSTALIAAGLALLFAREPVSVINIILGVASLAASSCFILSLWNAITAARPKPFNISGNHLEEWRTESDLYGELSIALIGQAEIYDEQIGENRRVLQLNAERIERALSFIKWAPVAALGSGFLAYVVVVVLHNTRP
jgi:hypothetical protein